MTPYYQDAAVTLYHGDCREILPGLHSVDLVLTDPPYGVGFKGRWGRNIEIQGDADLGWLDEVFSGVFSALGPSGVLVSFYGWPHADSFLASWKRVGFRPLSHFVWIKNVWGLGYYTRGQHEQAYLLGKSETVKPETAISDVLEWTRDARSEHPTEKPADALTPIIAAFSRGAGTILDPFAGSGTTLRAAKDLGRRAIGIEIEERYCEIAAKRCAQEVLAL